jgi:hypothetical protein
MDAEKERAAFEQWITDSGRAHVLARNERGWYIDLNTTAWWAGWLSRARYAEALAAAPSAAQEPQAATPADYAEAEQDTFCDAHCTWRDHHPDCQRAEAPQQDRPLQIGNGDVAHMERVAKGPGPVVTLSLSSPYILRDMLDKR